MKAGFAEVVITPQDGRCILAGYGPWWSTGVHDDLYASAVYLEDGQTRALLIGFDLIGMEVSLIAQIKDGIRQGLDVERDNIFFTCTHTHEGPEVRNRPIVGPAGEEVLPDYIPTYRGFLAEKAREVAVKAASGAQEFDLMVNRSYIDENINRRLFLNDERPYYPPAYKDLIPITNQHRDTELGLLYFCPKGSRHPFGVIVNYTMHPLTAGNTSTLVSSDVPGVVRDLVKESMQCLTCYINGAAGDNHPKAHEGGFAETRRVGQVLATEAIKRRYDALTIKEPVELRCKTGSISLRLRTAEELRAIPHHIPDEEWERRLADIMKRIQRPGAPVDVEFTLLAIGPVLFIGVPGEMVAELGSILKWSSPFKRSYIMYQATESLGYIAHPNAFKWGGYEAISGQLSPSSVRPLIEAIVDAAEELATK